ncbi:MAG: hypothetical protein AB7J32_26535 [Pseudonocardia sp.]
MLIPRPVLDGILAGTVTVAFRRWTRPRVRPGTRMRTVVGLVEVVSVEEAGELTETDARAAGYRDLVALRKADTRATTMPDGLLYRITLRPAGADPRVALREDGALDAQARAVIAARLQRWDAASHHGPWTAGTLALIARRPAVRAPELAAELGRETAPFKRDVRKLKELGLTESLPVGYRLSPRGRAYLGSDGEPSGPSSTTSC